jgi:hypothetical protein
LALLVVGFVAQSYTFLNHDVAWVLYSSNLMLDGAKFGTDIIAANPPLIWWISLIPNGIARLLGVPPIEAFRLFVLLLAAMTLYASDRLLAERNPSFGRRIPFIAVAAYLLTIGVHRDFGQREHLALMLLLPYILAVALRMDGRSLPSGVGISIGACAGLGVAFKPYFLLVPLLLESALLWRTRQHRLVVRPEALGAAIALVIYSLAIVLFAQQWLTHALPEVARVYWAFERSASELSIPVAIKLSMPLIGVLIVLRINSSYESVALSLAALGFLGSAILQGKYYSYHVYPAYALFSLAFLVGIPGTMGRWRFTCIFVAIAMLGASVFESTMQLKSRSDRGDLGSQISSVTSLVARHTPPDGSFLAISTHPFPGFPTTLYARRRWASASNSALFLPAVIRLRAMGTAADPELLRFTESKAREALERDLANKPDVILVDVRIYRHAIGLTNFNYLNFYFEDPKLQKDWAAYSRLEPATAGFEVYLRRRDIAQ